MSTVRGDRSKEVTRQHFLNCWNRFKSHTSTAVGHWLVAGRDDDQYIASYPRSGSTWLRTILVNLIVPDTNSNPDIFNARIPGVSIRESIRINRLTSPRLIKTHSTFRSDIQRAVYILRDGRDALVSFYHYQTARQGRSQSFAAFADDYLTGVYGRRWDEHVLGWLTQGREALGEDLLMVRFEDLRGDPQRVIGEITSFLGLDASRKDIAAAIAAADINNARRIELERGDVDLTNPNASFYRAGASGDWKSLFEDAVAEKVMRYFESALIVAGYQS